MDEPDVSLAFGRHVGFSDPPDFLGYLEIPSAGIEVKIKDPHHDLALRGFFAGGASGAASFS